MEIKKWVFPEIFSQTKVVKVPKGSISILQDPSFITNILHFNLMFYPVWKPLIHQSLNYNDELDFIKG